MIKKCVIIAVASVLIGFFLFFSSRNSVDIPTIVILKSASHHTVDAAADGFLESFCAGLGSEYAFVTKSVAGLIVNAQAMAKELVAQNKIKGFFVVDKELLDALVLLEKKRPIFFTGFEYPKKNDVAQENVFGVSIPYEVGHLNDSVFYELGFRVGFLAIKFFLEEFADPGIWQYPLQEEQILIT